MSGGNVTKTPFAQTMNTFAQRKVQDNLQQQGQVLPCSVVAVLHNGTAVTVAFQVDQSLGYTIPQVTMPVAISEYVRIPIQVGDTGIALSASTRLGGISGLGSGLAPLNTPSNLGALVFMPISNIGWSSIDSTAVVISSAHGESVVTISDTQVSLVQGSTSIVLSGGNVNINGTLIINGQPYLSHKHTGVKAGTDTSGGVA
jgi:hypothetical protein